MTAVHTLIMTVIRPSRPAHPGRKDWSFSIKDSSLRTRLADKAAQADKEAGRAEHATHGSQPLRKSQVCGSAKQLSFIPKASPQPPQVSNPTAEAFVTVPFDVEAATKAAADAAEMPPLQSRPTVS